MLIYNVHGHRETNGKYAVYTRIAACEKRATPARIQNPPEAQVINLSQHVSTHLRLHVEEQFEVKRPEMDEIRGLAGLCRSFQNVTGWRLRCAPTEESPSTFEWSKHISAPDGRAEHVLALEPPVRRGTPRRSESERPNEDAATKELADSIGELIGELNTTRFALWQREAELAAGVPIAQHADDESHLAGRLETVLQAGAKAVGCQAAAAYMLDDATRRLKLRSCWGLPKSRLLDPPRQLRGAAADLEALVGHAVVMEDTSLLPHWKVPEEFRSAVCVPISSPTTPLGTLWMFCDRTRKFSVDQTNLIEIVAGRLAADLEREMLLQHSLQSKTIRRQLTHAAGWQHHRLPRIKPLLHGWQVAGWTQQGDCLGGDFFDWFVLPDGSLAVAVGDAQGKMIEAGLTAAALHTALKSHASYRHSAQQMVERINETLWTASAGDQFASLFYAMIQPDSGKIEHAAAGHVYAAIVGDALRPIATADTTPLGTQPDAEYRASHDELASGEVLVVFSEGIKKAVKSKGGRVLWRLIQRNRERSADELADKFRSFLDRHFDQAAIEDQTVLVVKRVPH